MEQRPTLDQVRIRRSTLRVKQLPKCYPDTSGAWEGVGRFQFGGTAEDLTVTWQVENGERKSARFLDLCRRAECEGDRLELGWLIADVIAQQKWQEMASIPSPTDAMSYVRPLELRESSWRHWAQVAPGKMLFSSATRRSQKMPKPRVARRKGIKTKRS